jgi:autotransporter-associated beta strand protein
MKTNLPSKPFSAALASVLLLLPAVLHAQVSQKFTTSGTFTPPAGVTSVTVEAWGGGGAGGSAQRITSNAGGGGGGGGAYAKKVNIPVTPGTEYTVTIPAAALAPASGFADGDTVDGADVTFTGDSGFSVTASGGKGGQCAINRSAPGGPGGAAGTDDLNGSGGNGGTQSSGNSGGGGSGASDLGNGNNGSGNTPGATKLGSDADHNGGAGGVGRTGSNIGGAGTQPGGGGGGGRCGPNPETRRGGAGGGGQIIITYTPPPVVKDNNTQDLSLGASWVGGNPPTSSSTAFWNHVVTSANTTSLGADLTWAGISIANPGGLVTIEAGNTLTLNGAIDMSAATQDLVLNCNLAVGGAATWDVAENRKLTLAGIVSGASSFNIAKQGAGTAILSGANTYSGATAVVAGKLQLGNSDVIPNGTGKGDVSVTSGATLDLNGFSETINGLSGAGFVDNTAADTTTTLTAGSNDSSSTFSGVMRNTGTNSTLNLAKIGSGQLILSGANTLGGTVTVSAGNLTLGNANPLANISGLTIGGAQLGLTTNNAVISAPITLSGNLTVIAQSGAMTLTRLNGAIGGSGNITFTTAANTFDQADTKVTLGGADGSFTGNVTITTARDLNNMTVRLGAVNALPTTALVTLDGGDGNGSTWADLNLFGFDQTLAGLANNGSRTGRLQRVYNSSATDATLTINNAVERTFGGRLGHAATANNNFTLVKSGAGTFTHTGIRSYSGNTTVNEGILSLGTANANDDDAIVTIAETGATLDLTFATTDTVNGLFIGETGMGAGVYGAEGSEAPVIGIPQITGTGTLTVTSGPGGGFAAWQTANSTAGGLEEDHDQDGVTNGIEYFIGGATDTTGFTALPGAINTGGVLSVTWNKAADYTGNYGSDFWVETSETLSGAWTTEKADPEAGFTVTFPSAGEVRFTFPAPLGAKKFARLKVAGP